MSMNHLENFNNICSLRIYYTVSIAVADKKGMIILYNGIIVTFDIYY